MKYLTDSYQQELTTTITHVTNNSVVCQETICYPVGGGQPSDHAVLHTADDTYQTTRVVKKNGHIHHEVTDTSNLHVGQHIRIQLDWNRRYTLMRMHTAIHVLSRFLYIHEDATVTGNQLGVDESRLDVSIDDYDSDRLLGYEQQVNDVLAQELVVSTRIVSREDAQDELEKLNMLAMGLPAHIQEVRLVQIGDYDIQACAGTHVKNTCEIGTIRLLKTKSKGANRKRIYFSLSQ